MAQERRNLFRGWNASLAITTFALSLLGTFLVRSGVLTSVHSFAVDPWRGLYLLAFLAVVILGSFGLLIMRVDTLRANARLDGSLSREATLLFNNLFLIVTAATVFVGTLYPLAAEVFTGARLTVAAPYFNTVVIPIMVALVALMAIGPVMPWRKAGLNEIKRLLLVPGLVAVVAVAIAIALGVRGVVPLAAVAGMALVLASISVDVRRSVGARSKISGQPFLSSLSSLALWNRRRYGGLIVHVGIVIIAFGILASGLFTESKTIAMSPGDQFEIGGYTLTFKGAGVVEGPNWTARQADVDVTRGEKWIGVMQPQRRTYPRGNMTTTEAAIRSTLAGDLYIVVGEQLGGSLTSIRAYYIPLVCWIWGGWLVVIAGALFALSQGRSSQNRVSLENAAPAQARPS
jgi:cytochrome c-type biogenesis protein CcmF